jgi:hypothetical protein
MNFGLLRNKPMHKDIPTDKVNIQRMLHKYIEKYTKYITYILNEQEHNKHVKWDSEIHDVITMLTEINN